MEEWRMWHKSLGPVKSAELCPLPAVHRRNCPKGSLYLPPSLGQHPPHILPERRCWAGLECTRRSRRPRSISGLGHRGTLPPSPGVVEKSPDRNPISHQGGEFPHFNGKINLIWRLRWSLQQPGVGESCPQCPGGGPNPFPARSHPPGRALLSRLSNLHLLPAASAVAKPSGFLAIVFQWHSPPLASGPVSPSPRMALPPPATLPRPLFCISTCASSYSRPSLRASSPSPLPPPLPSHEAFPDLCSWEQAAIL